MEAKLNESISTQDWYSAHQLLLSLAQRHQRARRFSQSKKLLATGLKDMCPVGNEKSWPPLATTIDIAEKYVEVYEATPTDESPEIEESCMVFSVILAACDADKEADEKHTGVWADVSGKLAAKSPSLVDPFYDILLGSSVPLDWKTSWAVEHLSGQKEAWSRLAESAIDKKDLPCDLLVCSTVMHLLAQKAFGSASTFLKTVLSQLKEQKNGQITFTPIDDANGNLPSFLCFLESSTEKVSLLNAAQLFFLLAQRKSPAKSHFHAVRDRFKLNEELSQLSDLLSRVYSPQPKRAQEPMNPLASMFQNMFSGGAMPPMPQSGPTTKKASSKKPALDLD